MIQVNLDGPLETIYPIWVCETCGHEEDVFDGDC